MADVTDPEVLKFLNEALRPLSEDLTRLQQKLTTAKVDYTNNILPKLGADTDTARDRESEGVTVVTVLEIKDMAAQINVALSALNTAGYDVNRSKFNVRDII